MNRLRLLVVALLLVLLSACAGQPAAPAATVAPTIASSSSSELNVFAAASLTEAFGRLGRAFEEDNPGVRVVFSFAGSQQLAQQISQGAPADVFASANRNQMNALITSGAVISGTEQVFVRNRLVVITPKDNPANITSLTDLAKPGVKLILADQAVPVGQYALDFLAKASQQPEYTAAYSQTVLSNVVSYEENVRVVLGKIALGEGDAGIVYSSDVVGTSATQVVQIAIPDPLNTIATYPIAPINGTVNTALAQRFIAYVLSPAGQQTLQRYGFIPASGG